MNENLNFLVPIQTDRLLAARQERRQLLKTFWLIVGMACLFLLYVLVTNESVVHVFGASLIIFTALLPLYLWCRGKALGIPIYPMFALTFVWTYALPLVTDTKKTLDYYSAESILFASFTVAGFLVLGTFTWFRFVNKVPAIPRSCRVLKGKSSEDIFLVVMATGALFHIAVLGNSVEVIGNAFSLIRAVVLGINVLAIFSLSYRYGTRELAKNKVYIFFILLFINIVSSAASLILVGTLSMFFLAIVAFTLGRKKIVFLPIILALICISFLHYGKAEMRAKYWESATSHQVQPWEYPAWYAEWAGYSFDYLTRNNVETPEKSSLIERAGLMHLLLLSQTKTSAQVSYLSGATYAIIPDLLVPRILNENKIRSHEGTYILNIHYGLQDRIATIRTTIGWGLLNEAYANFGLVGCAGLAIILGIVYGQVARWSMNTPILSFRSLVAVLMMSFAFQTEFSAGVYISALFQSLVPLAIISFLFMELQASQQNTFIYSSHNR